MKEIINFILSKYYEKLSDLQYKYDINRNDTTTEEGEEKQKELEIEIKIYNKLINDFEDIKCSLYNFMKD